MALQITITYGSTTIDLQAGGYTVLDGFYPQSPTKDGSLSEKIDLEIIGSSESDLSAKIRALELALEYARTHEGWQSAWLNFSPSTTLATWRDRIMDGAVLYDARLLKRWREKKAIVSLVIEREGSWNGAEVQIPLSNPNGTADTTGLRVYNCNDGATVDSTYKQNNYVDIAGASVLGDLPGATRLEITNLFAGTGEPMMVWIGHNFTNPSTFVWNFEGEDAEIGGSPADVADANSSSGYYGEHPGFYGNGFFNKALMDIKLSATGCGRRAVVPRAGTFCIQHIYHRFSLPAHNGSDFRSKHPGRLERTGILFRYQRSPYYSGPGCRAAASKTSRVQRTGSA